MSAHGVIRIPGGQREAHPSGDALARHNGRRHVLDETDSHRHRRFVTHLGDLDDGTVLATVEGRNAALLLPALAAQGEAWLAGVEQVALDPRPFDSALAFGSPVPAAATAPRACGALVAWFDLQLA